MENIRMEMLKAYLRGSREVLAPAVNQSDYLRGYETALNAVQLYLEALERQIEEVEQELRIGSQKE